MKMKNILSMLLAVVMVFACVSGLFGTVSVKAADDTDDGEEDLKPYEVAAAAALQNAYTSISEKVRRENTAGYTRLVATSADGSYEFHANVYTGEVYYKNTKTGQFLSTNPASLSSVATAQKPLALSQLSVKYMDLTGTTATMVSFTEAAQRGQVTIKQIRNGIRVEYTIGRTDTNYLLPGWITEDRFESLILTPICNYILQIISDEAYEDVDIEVLQNKYAEYVAEYEENPKLHAESYADQYALLSVGDEYGVDLTDSTYSKAANIAYFQYMRIRATYALQDPNDLADGSDAKIELLAKYKICSQVDKDTGKFYVIYTVDDTLPDKSKKLYESYIKTYCAETYTYDDKAYDTEETGYVSTDEAPAFFRMALEYSIADDGTLSVRLPANSIRYDSTNFTLLSVDVLPFFGAGNVNDEGYAFYPDGSGALLEFSDLRSQVSAGSLTNRVYGEDYVYYKISAKHQESIRMPVYGIVDTSKRTTQITELDYDRVTGEIIETKKDIVTSETTGFVAYLTEGEALASLTVAFGGSSAHNYTSIYPTYTPTPTDSYKLVDAISVSTDATEWTVASKKKYTDNFTIQIQMLSDTAKAAEAGITNYYEASWIGMAQAYRDFIWKGKNSFTSADVSDSLPLYIESFGTVKATDKILSIPVTVDKALTTFDDVITMYKELSAYKTDCEAKAAEYTQKAAAARNENNIILAEEYEKTAAEYAEKAAASSDMSNIKFKLTGFANGGMTATYPNKVKWMKSVGGARGFEKLLNYAANDTNGKLGIYPEFEFSYVANKKSFDGISLKADAARSVDNRYASQAVYDCVYQTFTTYFHVLMSPDAIAKHYAKFTKSYSKNKGVTGISASSLGSDLNSSFSEDNPQNREDSKSILSDVLADMKEEYGSVMISGGNAYTLKFADHIIDIPLDSSNYKYSSRTIPFIGMVLHGYVNYAGGATNEAGDSKYQLLRSIENGASLYYILSYANTTILKDDLLLNTYYSIRYDIWVDDLARQYHTLNSAIGSLQTYLIQNEISVIAERIPDSAELTRYRKLLTDNAVLALQTAITDARDNAYRDMRFQNTMKVLFENKDLIGNAQNLYAEKLAAAKLLYDAINDETLDSENGGTWKQLRDDVAAYQSAVDEAGDNATAEQLLRLEAAKLRLSYNIDLATQAYSAYNTDTANGVYNEELLIGAAEEIVTSSWGTLSDSEKALLKNMYDVYKAGGTWANQIGKTVTVSVDRNAVLNSVKAAYDAQTKYFTEAALLDFHTALAGAIDEAIASYYAEFVNAYIETLTYTSQNGQPVYETLTTYEYAALRDALVRFYVAKTEEATQANVEAFVKNFLNNANGNSEELTNVQKSIIRDTIAYLTGAGFAGDKVVDLTAIEVTPDIIFTEEDATDAEYVGTPYTVNDDSVVMVIYESADKTQRKGFILNYNVFDVTVRYNGTVYTISSYGFATVNLD